MTRIVKGTVCKTVGQLREVLKTFPDHLRIGGELEDCVTLEVWKIEKDDELSYEDEKCVAKEENRKTDFRRITITEGEE